jgi:protein-S-isoprenylcysteine O-methyltransferase Ste14
MSGVALVLLVVYGVVGLLFRMLVQLRLTGSTGFRGLSSGSPAELAGGLLFVASIVLLVLSALADGGRIGALDHHGVRVAGLVLAVAGILGTAGAQLAMGRAWRIGVDASERTSLVTGGPFAIVRNPIYTAMFPFFIGIALMTGNALGVVAVACVTIGLELQTRMAEEPHLRKAHGEDYRTYARRVGRFVPGVGRLRS